MKRGINYTMFTLLYYTGFLILYLHNYLDIIISSLPCLFFFFFWKKKQCRQGKKKKIGIALTPSTGMINNPNLQPCIQYPYHSTMIILQRWHAWINHKKGNLIYTRSQFKLKCHLIQEIFNLQHKIWSLFALKIQCETVISCL
jgi:hypothetical protein